LVNVGAIVEVVTILTTSETEVEVTTLATEETEDDVTAFACVETEETEETTFTAGETAGFDV
jgi:hypothetical protein